MANDLVNSVAKAGGAAAGIGAGGGLSYGFFHEAHGADLIALGNAYGLTAFAFIALILLIGGYMSLPATAGDKTRNALMMILVVFSVLSISGFLFQIFTQERNPEITINAAFEPSLNPLNSTYHLSKTLALTATINDHHGHRRIIADESDIPIRVQDGWEITFGLTPLENALRHTIETKVADAQCADGKCDLKAGGGDDAGSP